MFMRYRLAPAVATLREMSKWKVRALVTVLAFSVHLEHAAGAPSAQACNQTLGKARAQRLVNQCLNTSTATRPPCNALNDCETIAEHISTMCEHNLGENAPAYCGESKGLARSSEPQIAERYAATVGKEQAFAARLRERIKQVRSALEPLAAQHKEASAALKKSRSDFDKELGQARAAHDKYKNAATKPGASGLDEQRKSLLAVLTQVIRHGQTLAKDAEASAARELKLAELASQATTAGLRLKDALRDMKEAKALIEQTAVQLAQRSPKPSPQTASDAPRIKALSADAAAAVKVVQALEADAQKETAALKSLAAQTPAGQQARSQAFNAAKKTEQDRLKTEATKRTIEIAQRDFEARHSPTAPSARSAKCDLERVDFKNFAFPDPHNPKLAPAVYKRGVLVGEGEPEFLPKVSRVKYLDLDANGTKEAVVFIEGMPSAHSGPQNELIFLQLDADCRIQQLLRLSGGLFEGDMKGKSYVYRDTILSGVEGMAGDFASGTESVELRFVNGEPKEVSRKVDRN
jgi:hypothetical protein